MYGAMLSIIYQIDIPTPPFTDILLLAVMLPLLLGRLHWLNYDCSSCDDGSFTDIIEKQMLL